MKKNNPIIYIVDDDAAIRKSLERLLRSAGYQAKLFSSADEFLQYEAFQRPCCIILDVRMPGVTGLELQEQLVEKGIDCPIVFITGHGDIPMSVKAIKKGAVDFLSKPFDDEDLLNAITEALKKEAIIIKQHTKADRIQSRVDLLTPREYEVMEWILTGMLNKQIAPEMGISEKTLKIHRGRVMQKMQVDSVAELVRLTEEVNIKPHQLPL